MAPVGNVQNQELTKFAGVWQGVVLKACKQSGAHPDVIAGSVKVGDAVMMLNDRVADCVQPLATLVEVSVTV